MTEEYFNIAKTRIDAVDENTVTITDKQLSTQLPEGVQTTPDQKYEKGTLELIRNPSSVQKTPTVKKKKSKKEKPLSSLFKEVEL
jgi:hypothetical protein